jgi:hypothetical protein
MTQVTIQNSQVFIDMIQLLDCMSQQVSFGFDFLFDISNVEVEELTLSDIVDDYSYV